MFSEKMRITFKLKQNALLPPWGPKRVKKKISEEFRIYDWQRSERV